MVCNDCEKKLGKVITPDTWKAGARNTNGEYVYSMGYNNSNNNNE